jgi:hypothetical protein
MYVHILVIRKRRQCAGGLMREIDLTARKRRAAARTLLLLMPDLEEIADRGGGRPFARFHSQIDADPGSF